MASQLRIASRRVGHSMVLQKIKNIFCNSLLFLNRKIMQELGFNASEISRSLLVDICNEARFGFDEKLLVIDCGANIGEFSDITLGVIPNSDILMIEPQRLLCEFLKLKYKDLDQVTIIRAGIGLQNGRQKLYFREPGDRKASLGVHRENLMVEEIDVITLGTLCESENVSKIDILKLDVEGLDTAILNEYFTNGGHGLPAVVILEVSYLSHFRMHTAGTAFTLLENQGYVNIYRTSPRLGLIKITRENISDYEGHTTNWVAIA